MIILIVLVILFILLLFAPQWWARRTLHRYHQERADLPYTGNEFAQNLLNRLRLNSVKLEITEFGDHYDPAKKAVRLSQPYWQSRTLTAWVVASHEVGHAIQDHIQYPPFSRRMKWVSFAEKAEKIGAALLVLTPIVTIFLRIPSVGILMILGGLLTLGTSVIVHILTLPVEWDASFKRALPLLGQIQLLSKADQQAARTILTACALTYIASSLASLLNFWRWWAILRR